VNAVVRRRGLRGYEGETASPTLEAISLKCEVRKGMLITIPFCIVIIVVGVLLLVLAFFALWRGVRLVVIGVQVKGRVVDYCVEGDGDFPIVEFTDLHGTLRRVKLGIAGGWNNPKVGGSMALVYDPNDPNVISASSAFAILMVPMMLGVFGGSAIFLGVFILTVAN
jgi:hypothetical protein